MPKRRSYKRHPLRQGGTPRARSEEHTSELQSQSNLVCRLLLEKKKRLFEADFSQVLRQSLWVAGVVAETVPCPETVSFQNVPVDATSSVPRVRRVDAELSCRTS